MANTTEMEPGKTTTRDAARLPATALWQIELAPAPGFPDRLAIAACDAIDDLKMGLKPNVHAARGFLVEGQLTARDAERVAGECLAEPIVHVARIGQVGDAAWTGDLPHETQLIYVLPKPGVTDPEAESALALLQELGYAVAAVRTFRRYLVSGVGEQGLATICQRVLHNEAIEQLHLGPLRLARLQTGRPYQFQRVPVPLREASPEQLAALSRDWQLSLSLEEMGSIQSHFVQLGREPTDVELETLAQTWSEHCSHKTLAGPIDYDDGCERRQFNNMLRETIFAATEEIRTRLADDDWCVSVFRDNAGVVAFDGDYHVTFKVETHNRPSALEPYGGANTGLGGVIRDTLGTGLGAKPFCSTDVFCFAPPEMNLQQLPPGVLHPRRIMKGVVAGVRDYGNRMGIPTVNGAVVFDPRFVGNPLVFCGSVGLLPTNRVHKAPQAGDLIVAIGGRTGRDGIHGATFSSAELTDQSERVSGGAVQIGNAITEKMFMDVLLQARDLGLYRAVTDCGAGGFSSAIGEMGEALGADVHLERAPLKYQGLSYTEIWISEAQERMILAVPPDKWPQLKTLCQSESVEATVLGTFEATGQLVLRYEGHIVGELSMEFLHKGRPHVVRSAVYRPAPRREAMIPDRNGRAWGDLLLEILAAPTVASKHWIIRQYDHEVLGGSAIKPLVGAHHEGPGDAAVVRPVLKSPRAVVVSCGINPLFGDLDHAHHAASVIDEAVRNCVAVGADPRRIGILDNFCWGRTDRPETLGGLVRAALACHEIAVGLGTPFISGKDSLHNEFAYQDAHGQRQTIAIPGTLLISALGQMEDAQLAVTMDLKRPGHVLFQVGWTAAELGGSHALMALGQHGAGDPPTVDPAHARRVYEALHGAIRQGWVRSCHDLSEGGLAVALAEMCLAGQWGARIDLERVPRRPDALALTAFETLFAESNSRFVCEVPSQWAAEFEDLFAPGVAKPIGEVTEAMQLVLCHAKNELCSLSVDELRSAWRRPLDWS